VEVETPPVLDLPMDLQTALLRIAQGAVANVRQHANARRASLTLRVDRDETVLVVADDGVGFDPQTVAAGPGGADSFGLRAIAERVAQLDGTLDIDSAPGRGTRLTVTVPTSRAGDAA
jgi:signal transduction histidine kinase